MSSIHLDTDITDTSQITSVTVSEAHNTPCTSLIINAKTTSLDMGSAVTAYLGYDDNKPKIFTGWVKQVEQTVPDNVIRQEI
jgi:hypothetical protein